MPHKDTVSKILFLCRQNGCRVQYDRSFYLSGFSVILRWLQRLLCSPLELFWHQSLAKLKRKRDKLNWQNLSSKNKQFNSIFGLFFIKVHIFAKVPGPHLLEKFGKIRFSQADADHVVKTIRKVEPWFSSFNEVQEQAGKHDRARQEIFLHENRLSLSSLPLEDFNENWLKSHRPS